MAFTNVNGIFKNRVWCGQLKNSSDIIDPLIFLKQCYDNIVKEINTFFLNYRSPIKARCVLCCDYIVKKGDTEIICEIFHSSKMVKICESDDFNEWYSNNVINAIQKKMEEFELRDSGKALYRMKYMQININKYNPTNGGSSYIKLPKNIEDKKAVVNVQNEDEECFIWSILASLYPAKNHPYRVNWYRKHKKKLNLKGINMPMALGEISKFEKQNTCSINVYGLELDEKPKHFTVVGPLHYTKCKKEKHVNLLYFKEEKKSHYACIKSLSRLLSSQLSKRDHKKFICDRCLQYFGREDLLVRHEKDCKLMKAVKIELPSEVDKFIQFKNFSRKEPHPFVVYADFECLTEPIDNCEPNPENSYTIEYQRHTPCAVAYQVVCSYDESLSFYKSHRGQNAAAWFMDEMENIAKKVEKKFKNILPIILTQDDKAKFKNAKQCHICNEPFGTDLLVCASGNEAKKVRDHNHLTGVFRGAAHNKCNLEYVLPNFVPVFFHNLSRYDSHLFLRELGKDDQDIILIPNNEEQYISFSKKVGNIYLRFLDSYRFLSSSLDTLASYMDPKLFVLMKKRFTDPKHFNLLTRKGVFCYDYVNSWDKLEETHLPPKEEFFSQLKSTSITDEEYAHAIEVWNTFGHKTIGDYTDLYLQTDVLLLADVFENFRRICLEAYTLDPTYYYTTPGLAWDIMLKITRVKLELLTDNEMLLFFEKGIRGGLCQCSKRYAAANNQYMESFDSSKEEIFLMYFDACNLYGYAMTQCLPYGNFKWLTNQEIEKIDIHSIPENGSDGFVFEVDLVYPEHLHDEHQDLPLCPEKKTPPKSKYKKLLATLDDKKEYVIHYRNLKQALELGLKLTKIHRAVKFSQSFWLKEYIDKNTEFRKNSKNDFEKNFFKLLNNAVYGKTIENIRNRRDIKLVSTWNGTKGARKLIAKPNFKKTTIISENLVTIELNKVKIKFNKPVYIGMVILDISKHLMYDFHYNYIHKEYTDPKLMYMDTDSLIYEFTEDPYVKIKEHIDRFDTSDYTQDNKFGIPQANKKVVGLFKDENSGLIMTEFAGLRAKMYSFTLDNEKSISKAKGVSTTVTKTLTIDDYKQSLFHNYTPHKVQRSIVSKNHNIFSIKQNKLSLSCDDDKRYILSNKISTLPWGHKKLSNKRKYDE